MKKDSDEVFRNNNIKTIHWFPGHMAKTLREINANLKLVDICVEIIDARIPMSSRNPEIDRLTLSKPRIILLNKCDLADANATSSWINYFKMKNIDVLAINCRTGEGLNKLLQIIKSNILKYKRTTEKICMLNAPIRIMVLGIPNVGKSLLINRLAGGRRTKVENKPGVTRLKQWVKLKDNTEILDMPGILWPKFDDQFAAMKLAFIGTISNDILDTEAIAITLLNFLANNSPQLLIGRYNIEIYNSKDGFKLLKSVGRKCRMFVSGGKINIERAAITILNEFRSGKLGRITLELPPKIK